MTREDGGLGGSLNFPVWSDPSGQVASMFDLYDEAAGECLEGVVILDDEGVVRHVMTTSMEREETASNALELVRMLRAFTPATSAKAVTVTHDKEKVFIFIQNKARMSYGCERLDLQGFNVYPLRTFKYTDASILG